MTVALTCDWLTTVGGAEQVLSVFHTLWPDAPLFTSVADAKATATLGFSDVRTSNLQMLYTLIRRHQPLLPLMPKAMENFDLRGYDVILSSSHAVGKGIVPPSNSVHICYCHTPMRYAWEMENEYLSDFHLRWPLKNLAKRELKKLRRWDLSTALRTDAFIANSRETQERIQRIYGRDSTVIPPPVGKRFLQYPLYTGEKDYYLALGRLVPYKRFDLLISLANQLKLPLKIGGIGQDMKRLKSLAGPTVEFLGFVKDDDLPELYSHAKALLFPQHEDAGIVPLEAQACGTPVIAYGKGGVLDSVDENVTGIFAADQSVESFSDAIQRFETTKWDSVVIRKHAGNFSEERFKKEILEVIDRTLAIISRMQPGRGVPVAGS